MVNTPALLTKLRLVDWVSVSKLVPSVAVTLRKTVAPPPEFDAAPIWARVVAVADVFDRVFVSQTVNPGTWV
jgi:hypothetical protein